MFCKTKYNYYRLNSVIQLQKCCKQKVKYVVFTNTLFESIIILELYNLSKLIHNKYGN